MAPVATDLHLSLPADESAPSRAREAIRRLDGGEWVLGDAMLVASELLADVIHHGPPGGERTVALALERLEDRLLISVTGEQAAEATEAVPPTKENDGIGLKMVQALSIRCGTDSDWARRTWAELPLPSAAGG